MADTSTIISEVNMFLEGLRKEMPEIFAHTARKTPDKAGDTQTDEIPEQQEFQTTQGDKFLYNGIFHELKTVSTGDVFSEVAVKNNTLYIAIAEDETQAPSEIFTAWLKEQAEKTLVEKTAYWAERMNLQYSKITVKDQKTLWGSCSVKGNLNYCWRIIKAPPAVLEYLVIHELSHLVHMDHTPEYWDYVAQWCPEYKTHRLWLRNHVKALFQDTEVPPLEIKQA